MKVKDLMTRNVEAAYPSDTIQAVARRMADGDFGYMPVCDARKVIGAVTDRDLTVRALAAGLPPSTPVAEVMTNASTVLRVDDDAEEVLEKMGETQVRRLPVVDDLGELVGVVSIGDLSQRAKAKHTGEALKDISKPGGHVFS